MSAKTALALAAILLAFIVVGTMDYAHELELEAARKEARAARAKQAAVAPAMVRCPGNWIAHQRDGERWRVRCVK